MPRPASTSRRKPRLRTELSEADEQRLTEAVALFGLPKAEVVRRLIRASVQAGPALSAENTRAVVELASQVRMVGRNLSQVLKAIHRGQAVRIEDTKAARLPSDAPGSSLPGFSPPSSRWCPMHAVRPAPRRRANMCNARTSPSKHTTAECSAIGKRWPSQACRAPKQCA